MPAYFMFMWKINSKMFWISQTTLVKLIYPIKISDKENITKIVVVTIDNEYTNKTIDLWTVDSAYRDKWGNGMEWESKETKWQSSKTQWAHGQIWNWRDTEPVFVECFN